MPDDRPNNPERRPRIARLLAMFAALWCAAALGPALGAQLEIQHWETANGARVYFVPAPELPMVDVQVVFDAGSARDGDRPGVAQLTSRLLDSGAGGLDADAIAESFEDLGARFSTESHRDMAIVNLRSLSDPGFLGPAIDTFALVLRDPTFPDDALERERARLLTALQREEQSPGSLASNAFWRAVYRDHPYGSHVLGTPESLAGLGRTDVAAHHRAYYVARNAVIALVGALDRAGAEALAERLVRDLPAGDAAPGLPPAPALDAPQRIHVEFPSSQTHILAGQAGMLRDDPDYFPLYVGNHILGGSGLVSRISDEIRDKRGLAYSAYSYFTPMRAAGPYILGLQTQNEQAESAIEVLFDTVGSFIDEGPTAKELSAASRNITGGFPLRIASNRDIAGNLAVIGFYGLPLDYLDTFNAQVEAVTRAQIREAYQRRVDLDRMVTVTVGRSAQ
jgi:zinc protease